MCAGHYQVLLLGSQDHPRRGEFLARVEANIVDLGLPPTVVRFIDERDAETRDRRAPAMGIYFGSTNGTQNGTVLSRLIEDSIVIAPVVTNIAQVAAELPEPLRGINALEVSPTNDAIDRLAALVLETFRLLRRQRRLFISYRRTDAQPFANLLYDALDARGFDVFIDVRSVPPAADFQAEIWHRMCDSDVVVLIDTPSFRDSRWTVEELARANATNIQILHVLWPGQREDASSALSHFFRLTRRDFASFVPFRGQWPKCATVERICREAESLRARAIAARYRYLVDNFCDAARDLGLRPSVQPEQWISLQCPARSRSLAVVPAAGVPTSDRINEIFDSISRSNLAGSEIWVIYDNRGVLDTWLTHLDWLDEHLPLRTVRMARAPDLLREWT